MDRRTDIVTGRMAGTSGGQVRRGPMGKIATEAFGNNVRRAYTYDCHGWIEGITTSIPGFVGPSLPDIPDLSASVSNGFYQSAYSGDPNVNVPIEPGNLYTDYTEQIMYATGSHPRYDGTASAHVATAGGRYDYLFDCHDRLIKAAYSAADSISALGGDVDYTENFSTDYTYNPVGVPLTVKRYGVQCIDNSSGTPVESFGILDNLSYTYDGMLLNSVTAFGSANGEEYYGRTGFPLSALGGLANYEWNAAGLLSKDSAREITGINYNWNGQPTKISFADKGYMAYSYASTGALRKVETYAMLTGKRPTKVSERTYCGDFVFEGDSLLYANFAGGYFDGAVNPHYRHADFQGNISMVTNWQGQIEQHTGCYPYGEPWREPAGQPYLYGGKERMRDHALNDYDFGARRLSSALCLWTTPDPLATDYAPASPYSYCAGNPIKYTDPTGRKIEGISRDDVKTYFEQINAVLSDEKFKPFLDALKVSGKKLSIDKNADIASILSKIDMNEDEQCFVNTLVDAINEKSTIQVEFIESDNDFSEEGKGYIEQNISPESVIKVANFVYVKKQYGGALTTDTPKGAYAVMVKSNVKLIPDTFHESLGHGLSFIKKLDKQQNNDNAIRMDNVVRRILNIKQRDGKDHHNNPVLPYSLPVFH